MRIFGPTPQATLEWTIQQLESFLNKAGNAEGARKVANMRGTLNDAMKEVDGTINIEGNPTAAYVCRVVRAFESLAKLGGALISSISDMGTFGSEFKYQGRGFFSSLAEGIQEFIKGRGSLEQQRILGQCGVFFDSMKGAVAARFSGEDMPGKMVALQNLFFKMNGLTWWTECWKKAACLMLSHDLAQISGTAFNQLAKPRQRLLSLYGIGEKEWNFVRGSKKILADGREYLTPESISQISDAEFGKYLKSQGRQPSEGAIRQTRQELEERLRSLIRDRVQFAVLEPDAANRRILHRGTAVGTVGGEVLRFATQFKSFPTLFLQRPLQREIYGRGADTIGKGLAQTFKASEAGDHSQMAQMFLAMTLLGYGAMTVKQLIAGKTPRPIDDKKTWLAAALQGGGLGIFGDFLFAERSRMGNNLIANLAGPTAGSVEGLYNIYQQIRDGDMDAGPETYRLAFNHVPGNNLFWFRAAYDHLIGYSILENMKPGYMRRMKRRIWKENKQTFWWDPAK